MNKTIIAVHGRASEGKSDTIKRTCKFILSNFPNAIPSVPNIDYGADILLTIQLGSCKIGIESQGDPNSRMINDDTVANLAKQNCDIIICSTRTEGKTVQKVDQTADNYKYHTLWISSFWGPHLNHSVLNQLAALNIVGIVKALIIGQL